MICFRCYDERTYLWNHPEKRGPWVYDRSYLKLSLSHWMMHVVAHADLHGPLLAIGILDAEEDGAEMFWRWDPWNAKMARALRYARALARRQEAP